MRKINDSEWEQSGPAFMINVSLAAKQWHLKLQLISNDTKDEISKKQPANELPDDEFSFLRKKKALAATSSDESQNQKSPTAEMENYLCDASS